MITRNFRKWVRAQQRAAKHFNRPLHVSIGQTRAIVFPDGRFSGTSRGDSLTWSRRCMAAIVNRDAETLSLYGTRRLLSLSRDGRQPMKSH